MTRVFVIAALFIVIAGLFIVIASEARQSPDEIPNPKSEILNNIK